MSTLTPLRLLVAIALMTPLVGLGGPALAQNDNSVTNSSAPQSDPTKDSASQSEPTKDPYEMQDSGAPSAGTIEIINSGASQSKI
jgi:hypothetical protein